MIFFFYCVGGVVWWWWCGGGGVVVVLVVVVVGVIPSGEKPKKNNFTYIKQMSCFVSSDSGLVKSEDC